MANTRDYCSVCVSATSIGVACALITTVPHSAGEGLTGDIPVNEPIEKNKHDR